jgi:FKBP-type peptidyl-prolyl cis-trans isomerase FklB
MKNEEFATAVRRGMRSIVLRMWMLAGAAFFILHSSFFISCSEEEAESYEFENWKERNDAFFASLADSLEANPTQWERILSYSLNTDREHASDCYIYVKKLVNGEGTESPAYTDSVRAAYRGRLIPSATYPEGYVFDETAYGAFSTSTAYSLKSLVSNYVDGYSTALQHMHKGDTWRVYIPYNLGYGDKDITGVSSLSVPAYSVIIFDVALIDFCHAGETMPAWSSRRTD